MLVKGTNLHLIPEKEGWCVIDEGNQMVVLHFATQEQALHYANQIISQSEGCILVHRTPYHHGQLSTVTLPQHSSLLTEAHSRPGHSEWHCNAFESFLQFDESYFEI